MRSFIVGTAGHIDHGKSALVQALTGTDPDRLKEEKERGITIDLGFAHADLGDGVVASFIDVPGHERFVRNMLAGAYGIDAVLLVVAADESVMPQTREHFHICRLLGIRRGIVALTKCDAADADMQAIAELEVRELVAGSFLEAAPILRVSARTGEGLPDLRAALLAAAREAPERSAGGVLRLPVDRVFVLKGFGTVVTGTLVSGALAVSEELEVLPSGRRARVRGLQVHGRPVEQVSAGHRAAVNLAGIETVDLSRGDVLTHPGALRATTVLDVELDLLPGERPLKNQARVRVHVASAEVLARVRLPGGGAVEPGGRALGQLRLESRAVAARGDRLVLRSYSPPVTIGGARVLDPLPPRRRTGVTGLEHLKALASATPGRAAALMAAEAGTRGVEAAALAARVTMPVSALLDLIGSEPDVERVGREPAWVVGSAALRALSETCVKLLDRLHRENPLKAGVGREELRRRLFTHAPAAAFEVVLGRLAEDGVIRLGADTVALARHAVTLTPDEERGRRALVEAALGAGLAGLDRAQVVELAGRDVPVVERVSRLLLSEGVLQRVGDSLLVHREHLDALKARVRERWPAGTRLDVAELKEMTGLTRKYVIPLLEYLDRERVTRRSGADRLVL